MEDGRQRKKTIENYFISICNEKMKELLNILHYKKCMCIVHFGASQGM